MSFEKYREWLARKLAFANDAGIGAGGTSLEDLRKDAEARTVTPAVLSGVPGELGRVVRYVREQRGWTRRQMADLASIDEEEVKNIEQSEEYEAAPRTLVNLAELCGFSARRFQLLARHIVPREERAGRMVTLAFAAKSKHPGSVSDEEFEAVRTLVQVLSDRTSGDK